MVYMRNFGRPIGMEPKIFLKPPGLCDCGPGECTPWCPSIATFENEFAARLYYKKSYPNTYEELEVINE